MNFLKTSPALKIEEITTIEHEFNFELPVEFKEHYLKFNGGCPENDKYIWPDGNKTRINTFSSIKYEGFDNLEDTYRNLILEEKFLPIGVIPFAADDGGNLFCISSRKEDFGSIYYCNNDHYDQENKEECLSRLDISFKHFINSLSS